MRSTQAASPRPPDKHFLVGKDSHGRWVVQDEHGLCGGLFANRTEALHFAMFENGNRSQAVIMVPDVLEFDLSGAAQCLTSAAKRATPR